MLPLDLLHVDPLNVLRLEAVLPALGSDEVADLLVIRVSDLEDIEDDVELLPVPHEVVVGKKGPLMGFLKLVGWLTGSL